MAERRVALIIGNASYVHANTLLNTVNDADAMTALFKNAGFDVVDERRNVGVVEFKRSVREFLSAAANADIAVVYYSGHGIEIGGVNYLIPVDARLASEFDVDDEAIPLDRIITATQSAKKLSLIILDACRDNPFLQAPAHVTATRSIANRLVRVEPTSPDTLVAYAAKAGSVSYDGSGADSPFTTALVKYIATPGLDIRIAFGKVRDDVMANTANRQEPFVYGSLGGGDISLVPAPSPSSAPAVANPGDVNAATDYVMAERIGSRQAWEAFLTAHASGYYASLARAQLAKLTGVEPPMTVADLAGSKTVSAPPPPPAAKPPDKPAATPPTSRDKQAALQPNAAPVSQEQSCAKDSDRLAKLRRDPTADQVAAFARDLTCEDLRPQVRRFMESLGLEPIKERSGPAPAASVPTAIDVAQACKRDGAELARIRANPDHDQAVRFARDLKCEDLRPQAARLLESYGE